MPASSAVHWFMASMPPILVKSVSRPHSHFFSKPKKLGEVVSLAGFFFHSKNKSKAMHTNLDVYPM